VKDALVRLYDTNARLVVSNIVDYGVSPAIRDSFAVEERQRVTDVIQDINQRLRMVANQYNTPLVDMNGMLQSILGLTRTPQPSTQIGGVTINNAAGREATNAFVDDGIHLHTVIQAQVANLLLTAFDLAYETPVDLFTEAETLAQEGLTYGGSDTLNLDFASFVRLPANAAPVLTGVTTSVSYTENKTPATVVPGGVVVDSDLLNFANGQLTATIVANALASDQLTIRDQGSSNPGMITVSGDRVLYGGVEIAVLAGGMGTTPLVVTFNANADQAAVQALLRTVIFGNVGHDPTDATREIEVQISDGDGGMSNTLEVTATVTPVNDAPVLVDFGGAVAYTEDAAPVAISTTVTVGDADSSDFAGGVLTLEFASPAADNALRIRNTGPISTIDDDDRVFYRDVVLAVFRGGIGTDPLRITFNARGNSTRVEALLRSIVYHNTSNNPTTAARTLRATFSDGDGGPGSVREKSITVTPVNDKPVIADFGEAVTYVENSDPAPITTTGRVIDVDSPNFDGGDLIVKFLSGGLAQDRLAIRSGGAISTDGANVLHLGVPIGTFTGGVGTTPLRITLNAQARPGSVQSLLRNIVYSNVSETPLTSPRTVWARLIDGDGAMSEIVTKPLNVIPANDAPILGDVASNVDYAQNSAAIALAGSATVRDVDSPDLQGGKLTAAITAGADPSNRLEIIGSSFSFSGLNLLRNGVVIGVLNDGGGVGETPLEITFNSRATPAIAAHLMRSIHFRTDSGANTDPRTVSFTLSDGDGGTSNVVATTVTILS
jgi:hypothetical protein